MKTEAEIGVLESDLAGIDALLEVLGKEAWLVTDKLKTPGLTASEKAQAEADQKAIDTEIRKLKAEKKVKIRALAAKKAS